MRGQQERSDSLFSYVSIEERIPASHPLRRIRRLADQALDRLNPHGCLKVCPSRPWRGCQHLIRSAGFRASHAHPPPSAAATQPTPDDLIRFLKAIPDSRYRRGVRYPQWFLLLVAVLGIYCFSSSRLRLRRRLTPTAAAAVPVIWRPLPSGTEIC